MEILALKDKQYCPKTTEPVIELELKPEEFYFWKVQNIFITNGNVKWAT